MTFILDEKEIELSFTTKNYTVLKKKLGTENLRKCMLKALNDDDYEILAKGIIEFSEIKSIDEAYRLIDTSENKHELFLKFVYDLGENGFFEKATMEELKTLAKQPEIDIQSIINKIMPDIATEMLKETMMTGGTTLPI